MATNGYVAFDLGAESGRAMLAILRGDQLEITEVHRFLNTPQRLPSGLHWNLLELWANLVEGLRKSAVAARNAKVKLVSLGVDTWGLDYGLVGASGELLGLPFNYRDDRNAPAMKAVIKKVGRDAIYDATGIQFMHFNTLYQLYAQHQAEPGLLAQTRHLLMMPDLLHYFFSGQAVNEATNVSTTQVVDPRGGNGAGRWAQPLLKRLGVPGHFLGKIAPAGTVLGPVLPHVALAAGLTAAEAKVLRVIMPGTHDTASAVAAVPVSATHAASGNWAYLSSGTWSLMGAELDGPMITKESGAAGFTNERGVGGKIRFLKNIAGMWLVQECRRDYARQGQEYSYPRLAELAAKAQPFRTLVDPNHGPFSVPGGMLAKLGAFARATGQPAPRSPGEAVRCCLESLALTYRHTMDGLEALLGRRMEVLHVVGGGGQNQVLNQMTADAIGRDVIVGPYEATAIGNALVQGIGTGQVRDLAHVRRIVVKSCKPVTVKPREPAAFDAQAARFATIFRR